jgi:hypothetical protein
VYSSFLLRGPHKLEVIGASFDVDVESFFSFSIKDGVEKPMTKRDLSDECPVPGVEWPETPSCSKKTVLMDVPANGDSGYLETGKMNIWAMKMKEGQSVYAETTGTEDIDLYLRWMDCPTKYKYDERGFTSTGDEMETFTDAPTDGVLYIGVRGYGASDY